MFKLIETAATIRSINPRAENHGDEHALACDIGLGFALSNKKLALLDDNLLGLLYQREENGADDSGQDALELEDDFLPHLRFPLMKKFPWAYEGAGYTFQLIDDRLHGPETIEVSDCKVKKFDVELEEGGTIKLNVQVQCNPSEETIAKLCHFIKEEVMVSLLPPERSTQGELEIDPAKLYEAAVAHVRESGIASVSNLRDALQITDTAAAKLLEEMEGNGIVSPEDEGERLVLDMEDDAA